MHRVERQVELEHVDHGFTQESPLAADRVIINDRDSLSRGPDRFTEVPMTLGPYDLYRNNLQEVP